MDDDVRDPDEGKRRSGFVPDVLDSSVIAFPLMERLRNEPDRPHHIVIDLNLNYPGGRQEARKRAAGLIEQANRESGAQEDASSEAGSQYVFATLTADVIKAIVRMDREAGRDSPNQRSIFHIWPDFEIKALA